jgi:hypothetical protein
MTIFIHLRQLPIHFDHPHQFPFLLAGSSLPVIPLQKKAKNGPQLASFANMVQEFVGMR